MKVWSENLKRRDNLEDLENNIKIYLKKEDGIVWIGLIWLRTGTTDIHL
jgi:hypothetical protein